MKTTIKKKYLIFAAAALTLAACSNDDENLNNEPVELRLSSGLGVETRATDVQNDQIANGETVYAWVDESDGTPYINAWELIARGNGGFRGTTQYFPQSGNNVNIYAIHGNFGTTSFTENVTNFPTSLTHTVSGTQTDAADVAKSDLLYAFAQNVSRNNGPTVPLTFNHLLSKVLVKLKAGDGLDDTDLTGATLSIEGTKPDVSFALDKTTGISAITAAGNTASITLTSSVSDYAEAIIVPQTLANNTRFIQVTLSDGAELYYTLPQEVEFKSGKKYTYDITVNLTELTVISTITDWATDEVYSGDDNGQATMQ